MREMRRKAHIALLTSRKSVENRIFFYYNGLIFNRCDGFTSRCLTLDWLPWPRWTVCVKLPWTRFCVYKQVYTYQNTVWDLDNRNFHHFQKKRMIVWFRNVFVFLICILPILQLDTQSMRFSYSFQFSDISCSETVNKISPKWRNQSWSRGGVTTQRSYFR